MTATVTTTKQFHDINEVTDLAGVAVTLVSDLYLFSDGVTSTSGNTLVSASSNFGPDVVGGAVAPVASKIASGVTVVSRTNSTTLVLSAVIANGSSLTSSVAGTDISHAGSTKTFTAQTDQTNLQNVINEYNYEPGVYNPQDAEAALQAVSMRAAGVLAGTDSWSSSDIQTILSWFLVSKLGATVGGVPTPGVNDPNPPGNR